MFKSRSWKPGRRDGQLVVLRLPARLIDQLAWLAELMGTDMSTAVVAELGAALSAPGPLDAPRVPGTFLDALYRAEHEDAPWQPFRLRDLPRWQHDALRELARIHRTTQSKALAALIGPQVGVRLAVAGHAIARGIGYYQAQRELVYAAPHAGSRRRRERIG